MPLIQPKASLMILALVCAATLMMSPSTRAQNGRPDPTPPAVTEPAPAQPQPQNNDAGNQPPQINTNTAPIIPTPSLKRRVDPPTGKINLAMRDVPVDESIIDFIATHTGKVVLPINLAALKVKKITVMHREPIEASAALDLVLTALRLNQVAVLETDEFIILDDITAATSKPVPVFTASDDVMGLQSLGNFIVKVYRLKEAGAEGVGEQLNQVKPDYALLSVDTNSNQIILYADVALAQHFQRLINELDRNWVQVRTETYQLKYADATSVADQIYELFESSSTQSQPGQPRQPNRNQRTQQRGAPGAVQPTPAGVSAPGPVVELRVSVNVQQNAVTVIAEPEKVDAIGKLIREKWDLPRERETFRVYTLEHTDPLKMQILIQNMMGGGSGAGRTQGRPAGQAGRVTPAGGAGGAGGAGVSEVIGDIYRVEAYADRNALVVMSKTKEALDYLDMFIAANDLPSTIGLPQIIELKHANAVSLADELNILLAETGTGGSLTRPGSGLSAQGLGGFDDSTGDGTSGGLSGAGTGARGGAAGGAGGSGGGSTIEFPWNRGRARDDQSEPSSLIGKVRIVPIVRQNALAIVAPVAQRAAVVQLIREFDRPGRQVMISAIIAEVQLTDDLALGVRFSSSPLSPSSIDNAIGGGANFTGTRNDLLGSLFDTSVLEANVDINVLIQALAQKTNIRIIQEPRVFTADNEEAAFFDGRQIPFITNSVVNSNVGGGVTQSFDYKNVGVLLNVRPRITVQRDVDMEIKLSLSAVVPGQTGVGGAFILDLRETTTKVIVKNAQTIVLSGLLRDTDSKITRALPILGDIPLLGELFKSRENSRATTELIAFITPIVVDNPSENDSNFNADERETLQRLSLPLKDQNKVRREQRDRVRDKIVAPKAETGEPLPELLPESATEPPVQPNRPQAAAPQSQAPAAKEPGDTIDVDDLDADDEPM